MAYVEDMLRNLYIYSIDKVVRPQDFGNYMRSRDRMIFLPQCQQKAFCFAVRRFSKHVPEGVLNFLLGRLENDFGLTQHVMRLFVTGPISSGLLSYDRALLKLIVETVDRKKQSVDATREMIGGSEENGLGEGYQRVQHKQPY